MLMRAPDGTLRLPALATAHSHAFQRALRGRGAAARPRRGAATTSGRWRGAMYELASSLTPESIHADQPRRVPRARARRRPHRGRVPLRASPARRHALRRPHRARRRGHPRRAAGGAPRRAPSRRLPPRRPRPRRRRPAQRRFCDRDVDDVLRDVDTLRARCRATPTWSSASRRTPSAPSRRRGSRRSREYAARHAMPLHMHVAEQAREVGECVAETGRRPRRAPGRPRGPVGSLRRGARDPPRPRTRRGSSATRSAFACICPTTERDLGDGLADLGALRGAGVQLCTGVDSHVAGRPHRGPARARDPRALADALSGDGAWRPPPGGDPHPRGRALARGLRGGGPRVRLRRRPGAQVVIRQDHPSLELVPPELLLDAIVFGSRLRDHPIVWSPLECRSGPGDSAPLLCRPHSDSPRGFEPKGDQPRAIEQLVRGARGGRAAPGAARHHRLGQDVHHRQRHPARPASRRSSSRPTRRSPRSSTARCASSSPRTPSSTSSATTTTTSPRRTSRRPTRTSTRTRSSTTQIDRMRHSATHALLSRRDVIIVASRQLHLRHRQRRELPRARSSS